MKIRQFALFQFFVIFQTSWEITYYNETHVFNWSQYPENCYVQNYRFTEYYRPYYGKYEQYPIRGCSVDDKNNETQGWPHIKNNGVSGYIANITFEPRLDYFFNHDKYPPADRDPPTSMTFKIVDTGRNLMNMIFIANINIEFGRCEDYLPIPKVSKYTGKPIEFIGDKAKLYGKFKFTRAQYDGTPEYNYSFSDSEIYDYEGIPFNATFDGYKLNFSEFTPPEEMRSLKRTNNYSLLFKVYDLPRMKVQGLFQYRLRYFNLASMAESNKDKYVTYTVDTRNVFFQNISMFYNQKVNVTDDGLEPTGEDSGFWVNTPCNQIQMATIMVDYHFFETIRRMKSYGFEFSDRFQLRIHTPFYRQTPNSQYSLFRSQWNTTYPEPRVFIHPISKYKEHCEKYRNCSSKFDYDKWSTDPEFTQYIIDIENEIHINEIWINFTELERIYEADGFHRDKLVINVNNTMTPHITQITNGLWAELYDLKTQDYVMKTKTTMDETYGYIDDYEPDPYRNFYLTCEIPDNITRDDVEFFIKKFGLLGSAHFWIRLDVFNKGITKLYPPRFNTILKFPPEILVNNLTFMLTYQYYRIPCDINCNWYWVLKDLRKTGIDDGTITNDTFDIPRNQINISELHHNYPKGDDTLHYTQPYKYLCYRYYNRSSPNETTCFNIETKRQFLYYIFDLYIDFTNDDSGPIDISVYHIKYIPHHPKAEINRGLHRWNPFHSGWDLPSEAIFKYPNILMAFLRYYEESRLDNWWYRWDGDNYWNLLGSYYSLFDEGYKGPDCVFDFTGGSTMRNRTCEFWQGIISDKPFTNYARDIYEEHIAYRTLNEDKSFVLNTSIPSPSWGAPCFLSCPSPYHYTDFYLVLGFVHFRPPRDLEDGDLLIHEYTPKPPLFLNETRLDKLFMGVINFHQHPEDFFIKLVLPKELIYPKEKIGKIMKCYYEFDRYQMQVFYPNESDIDFYCYFVNSTLAYAFNSLQNVYSFYLYLSDLNFYMRDIYYNSGTPSSNLSFTGHISWGFFEAPYLATKFPWNYEASLKGGFMRSPFTQPNGTITFNRENEINDASTILNISVTYKKFFHKEQTFKMDFDEVIKYMSKLDIFINDFKRDFGTYYRMDSANIVVFLLHRYDYRDREEKFLHQQLPDNIDLGYLVIPFYYEYYMFRFRYRNFENALEILGTDTVRMDFTFQMVNPRMIKPFDFFFTLYPAQYECALQTEHLVLINKEPQHLINLTITPNSYFTNDRAVYKIRYETYMRETLIGDVMIFKTSWKTKYNNNEEAPDDKGYYINKLVVERNYSHFLGTNMTLFAKPILNPSNFETQYVKDIHMVDKDGYLLSVYDGVVPIKMKKIPGFKYYKVYTNKTDIETRFDITFEVVPEILIDKNEKLKIKFSSAVVLQEYPECKLESFLGLNILDPDFKCEINITNNELILFNGFKDIGANYTIFENLSSIPITDQKFIFKLKDIPIYCKYNDHERIYSIELKTENDQGVPIQRSLLPSTAIFKCDYKCKTCEEGKPSLCITCNNDYPFFFPDEQNCRKFCPKEQYYETSMSNGEKGCLKCQSPCENCIGNASNCTLCKEGFFMQHNNNTCAEYCDPGYEKDFILRKCYPIIERNKTTYFERTVYVNVSIPDPYPVYIERNVCMIEKN